MIKKIIQFFIFVAYWLCLTPGLLIFLYTRGILKPDGFKEYLMYYTALFLILIIVYCLIHHIFDNCYMRNEIKKRVRKITIKRQLERFERGEISLDEAQRFSTFTKPKSPKTKRRSPNPQRKQMIRSPAPARKGGDKKAEMAAKGVTNDAMQPEGTPEVHLKVPKVVAPMPPPPAYSETVQSGEVLIEMNE